MRYFFALAAYVAAVVLAAASCGSSKGTGGSGTTQSTSVGTGGAASTGSSSSGSGTNGGGGSTGTLGFGGGGGDAAPCATYKGDCTAQGLNCGMVDDGCGNMLNCGSCGTGMVCSGANVCIPCTPKSCSDQGFNCGMATDTCGGILSCGTCATGEICGANSKPNVCGTGMCTPKSCSDQGFNCGMQGDTCGKSINCGTCATGQICGANQTGVCGTPPCMPKSCSDQGFNCGMATDTCGGILNCGTCTGTNVCGAGGPNVCGANPCTGLCMQQTTCAGGNPQATTVTGKVYAPNGTDPLYNVLVYVPNGGAAPTYGVQPFAPGVHCGACGSEVSGSPLVSTTTAVDGTFTLTNMPVGTNIPLVIQNGRWRRKIVIPNVASCATTAIAAALTRMPTKQAEFDPADNIPLMAFSTGSVDSLECVLRKIGVADSQFSDPATQGGTGRVRFYKGEGASGAAYSANTPSATQLWGTQTEINQYDMVYFPCQGSPFAKTAAQQSIVETYANSGGRIFATHYSYVWLSNENDATTPGNSFSKTAVWKTGQGDPTPDPQTGYINQSFTRGKALAQWLQIVGASTTLGQMSVNTLRHDFDNVVAPSLLWVSLGGTPIPPGTVPMHYTFDTPFSAMPANQCGRVLFDDFHVENTSVGPTTLFPAECNNNAMTAQEKMLEFMIFDLGSCVAPPSCTAKTCSQLGDMCGPAGDGCGNIIQCGNCPANQACVGGKCIGCNPKTCAGQGFTCGMQGDGCGNVLNCGTCPSGENCLQGTCGSGTCNPTTCTAQNAQCGSIGDGCGNILNCGNCPTGQICGGGGVPNQCFMPMCVPKNCTQQGFNCGMATDGCGNTLNCGQCSGTQTCGGCGTPNVCCGSG